MEMLKIKMERKNKIATAEKKGGLSFQKLEGGQKVYLKR